MMVGRTAIFGWATSITLIAVLFAAACGPNQKILNSAATPEPGNAASPVPGAVRSLQQDLQAMRNAGFIFIHIFRRKDGAAFDDDDRKFLAENMPQEINRRTISDEGHALVTGSNFRFPAENMDSLRGRFLVEDHSKPGYDAVNPDTNVEPAN